VQIIISVAKSKRGHIQRYSDIVCGGDAQAKAKFLLTLTFKNGFVGDIACSCKEGILLKFLSYCFDVKKLYVLGVY